MGLIIYVYRNGVDCTNGGVSSNHSNLCVVNVDGPFNPSHESPAVILESHHKGCLRLTPAVLNEKTNQWEKAPGWFMNGGNIGSTSDSRFSEKCEELLGTRFYGGVHIHDRQEN